MLRFQLIRRIFVFLFSYVLHLTEDFSDNEELFAKDMTKWNSNDLMDKIETIDVDEAQGRESFCWSSVRPRSRLGRKKRLVRQFAAL